MIILHFNKFIYINYFDEIYNQQNHLVVNLKFNYAFIAVS